MSELFLKVLNMSISASWLILAVLLLRLVLKRAPKWVTICLWGIVALRLICPSYMETTFSLIPSAETVSPEIMLDHNPQINTGVPESIESFDPIISESFAQNPGDSGNPLQSLIPIAAAIWLFGIALLLIYSIVSYWRLLRKVDTAVILRDNIFQSEHVGSPFVLGIIRPKIYLPYEMKREDMAHVIAHERAHIRRGDHWWKAMGFLFLTFHWFNPFAWLAYTLLCRDIELACDEKVIKELGREARADYMEALVACSVGRSRIAACPLAFGEVGVKQRVRSVMNYKKPGFWVVFTAIIACIAVAVCFLTNPKSDQNSEQHVGVTYYYGTVTDQGFGQVSENDPTERGYISLKRDDGKDMLFWSAEGKMPSEAVLGQYVMVRAKIEYRTGLLIFTQITSADHTSADNRDDAINNAILAFHWSADYETDGYCQCVDFEILAREAGGPAEDDAIQTEIYYGLALHQVFSVNSGGLLEHYRSYIPTVLTFGIDESGRYSLTEYWQPRHDYYSADIQEKFPANIWPDTQKYIKEQKDRNSAKASEYFCLTLETDDGYLHNGITYRYKLELSGKFPNSDVVTTFVVLTNRDDLTFDMIVKSMVSSNLEDTQVAKDYVLLTQP